MGTVNSLSRFRPAVTAALTLDDAEALSQAVAIFGTVAPVARPLAGLIAVKEVVGAALAIALAEIDNSWGRALVFPWPCLCQQSKVVVLDVAPGHVRMFKAPTAAVCH